MPTNGVLQVPPQSTPISDLRPGDDPAAQRIFSKAWYMAFQSWIRAIGAAGSGSAGGLLTWISLPALQNGWTASGSYGTPEYAIDSSGFVHMKGGIIPGTKADTTLLFTLPAGFRPASIRVITIPQSTGGTVSAAGLLITTGGAVTLYGASACDLIWLDTQFSIQ